MCRYCGQVASHLHHRTYRNLGNEQDADLEWACADHHREIHTYGSIQPATGPQKAILRSHKYAEAMISSITFGAAFELIGEISRGEVVTPVHLEGSASSAA
jgi:hypothetical protein